jgi:hypothetical protein
MLVARYGTLESLRFALRQLRKSAGFTLIVIATLAVCIGVNTAVFSVLWTPFCCEACLTRSRIVWPWWSLRPMTGP